GHRSTCPSSARAFCTAARSSARTRPWVRKERHRASPPCCGAASSMFSSTVSSPSSREIWKVRTRPIRARSSARRPRMLRPSKITSPDCGASSPPSTLKSVDLPAPFGPMMPVMLCRAISSEQPESASKPPNDLLSALAVSSSSRLLRRGRCDLAAVGPLHVFEDLATADQRLVRAQVHLVVAVVGVLHHLLLALERPQVLVHHLREGLGDLGRQL